MEQHALRVSLEHAKLGDETLSCSRPRGAPLDGDPGLKHIQRPLRLRPEMQCDFWFMREANRRLGRIAGPPYRSSIPRRRYSAWRAQGWREGSAPGSAIPYTERCRDSATATGLVPGVDRADHVFCVCDNIADTSVHDDTR
jgi:hypothetical protein